MTITIYSKPECGQCEMTKRVLDSKQITYNEIDITESEEALTLVKKLGYLSAPVVITDDEHWSGFRPDKIATVRQ